MKIGILGLDTSHGPAFAQLFAERHAGHALIGAWPGGSETIPASRDRVGGFTREIERMGIPIYDSPRALAARADALMILALDGDIHLPLYREVVRPGLPVFVDKPLANAPGDAEAIYRLAEQHAAPVFSAAAVRFLPGFTDLLATASREDRRHFDLSGPLICLAGMPRYHFYAVHSVELLVAALGPDWVECLHDPLTPDRFSLRWRNGASAFLRLRTSPERADFHGVLEFPGRTASFTLLQDSTQPIYGPLVAEIASFFAGGRPPVVQGETLAICRLLQAMEESDAHRG